MMVIDEFTLTTIGKVVDDFIGQKRQKVPITSKKAIELDLAGVQLLIAYYKENNIIVDIKLNESSLELLMKTGFHNYIDGDRFVLK
jgi:hypothetical protein